MTETERPKTLLDGFGEATQQVLRLREALRHEVCDELCTRTTHVPWCRYEAIVRSCQP